MVIAQHDLMVELFPECDKIRATAGYRMDRWVVADADTLVEARDPVVLADSLKELLNNPLKCEELRRAGSQRAKSFTIDRMAGLTYRSYCTALDIKDHDIALAKVRSYTKYASDCARGL